MPNIKISGITNTKDAKWAALLGVEYISISLVKNSGKKVSLESAAEILDMLPSYTKSIVELGDGGNGISLKKAASLKPDYFSVNDVDMIDIITESVSSTEKSPLEKSPLENSIPYKYSFILEISRLEEILSGNLSGILSGTLSEKLPEEIEFIQLNTDAQYFPIIFEFDYNNNKDIIINGDYELEKIIKTCKKVSPHAWSIRNAIEKSPRRIDYDKMKEYIREISLV
jgi:hypothetical protein